MEGLGAGREELPGLVHPQPEMAVAAASQAATHPGLTMRQPRTGIEQPTASARLVGVDAAKQGFAVGSWDGRSLGWGWGMWQDAWVSGLP